MAFVVAVIVIAAGILFLVNVRVTRDQSRLSDTKKMRRLYVAAIVYENMNDSLPPPELSATRQLVDDDSEFVASGDPFSSGSSFPVDPAFPSAPGRQNFRISFTYLPQWVERGKAAITDWQAANLNRSLGFLACYWYGTHTPTRADGLDSDGEVIRILMDGSARTTPGRGREPLLNAHSLFLAKP